MRCSFKGGQSDDSYCNYFDVILFLVLFAGPILNALDFLLGILEKIVDIFDSICSFVSDLFDGIKNLKRKAEQKKSIHDFQLLEKKREQQRKELQNFQTADQLPDDAILLERLYQDFKHKGDEQRAFMCLHRAVELGSNMEDELALLYLAGIGTKEDVNLAKKYQVQYFKHAIKSERDLPKWESWWKEEGHFRDLEGMGKSLNI